MTKHLLLFTTQVLAVDPDRPDEGTKLFPGPDIEAYGFDHADEICRQKGYLKLLGLKGYANNLPSRFQIGQEVDVDFKNSKHLSGCSVDQVLFRKDGPPLYGIKVPVGFQDEGVYVIIPENLLTRPNRDSMPLTAQINVQDLVADLSHKLSNKQRDLEQQVSS